MQILMINKYLDGLEVRNATMINKSGDISVTERVNTICFTILQNEWKYYS